MDPLKDSVMMLGCLKNQGFLTSFIIIIIIFYYYFILFRTHKQLQYITFTIHYR